MRVYPEPLQLVMILEKTLPEETFSIVMNLMSRDVSGPATTAESEGVESSAKGTRPKRKTRTGTSSRGPPSEASSQEWDKVTEPDASLASSLASLPTESS
jgi:import receptor subunit TOM20